MDRITDTLTQWFESITPILIKPGSTDIRISISKRFFLFNLMNKIINIIEEDPHLNFVAVLKSYKVLGKFLYGTLHEFHRDRNTIYFKNFFYDRDVWKLVKEDLESLYPKYKEMKMTITKRGVIVYDNVMGHPISSYNAFADGDNSINYWAGHGLSFNPFGEVIYDHQDKMLLSRCWWK
jgi:hypothetical protein